MNERGILVVVSGFSGAGKGTLMKALLTKYPTRYALSISATTRAPREGETEGISYFYKTKEAFEEMISKDELIEYAKYVDNYYGTPKAYVEEQLSLGKDVLLEIEVQGAMKVKEKFPNTPLLFITAPNAMELQNRLVGRGTESIEVIKSRMKRAMEEAQSMPDYDYILINDEINRCMEEMNTLIQSQHTKISEHLDFIANINTELRELTKGE